MAELILQAGDGHVTRLAHESDPIRSVVEMIWNSIDAEAWNVTVRIERDGSLGAITAVHVKDDGHGIGIGIDEVESAFGRIGDSWKARATRTKNDVRGLHGSLGEGRLRAFALGGRVHWRSLSQDAAGQAHEVTSPSPRTVSINCDSAGWRPRPPAMCGGPHARLFANIS